VRDYFKLFFILLMVLYHLIELGHLLNQSEQDSNNRRGDFLNSKNKKEDVEMKRKYQTISVLHLHNRII
jgi:hypothetical protein